MEIQPEKRDSAPSNDDFLNDWLPITKSRNAKWWYSAFHNVTAMVGAGVLGLPYACSLLGWGPGVAIMVLSWVITLYTLWQMVEMHEMVPGKRFDRYHELGQHAFGEKLGLWVVVPLQLMCEVGVDIVYVVTGGTSIKKIYNTLYPDGKEIRSTWFYVAFGALHIFLSHLPSFNSITAISFFAALMSLSYSTIAWVASVRKGVQPTVSYGPRSATPKAQLFDFFSGLGDVAFAFAGHNVVLEIQATIPSTPGKPSKGPMWKGVVIAYLVVAACYFPVAFCGYLVFGNQVEDNVLVSLEKPAYLIVAANAFVLVHVIGSYQVFAMPVFDMMESFLVKQMHFKPSLMLRTITRTSYVLFTMLVAITLPFFGGLLSFLGGFSFAPTSYYIPCIIWLIIYKPKRFSLSWFANYICIGIGVILTILGPIGGMISLIHSSQTFKFFS
ncbi:Lysine histidine transporter 2 -like protein [Gossypium arboreum]|uniref:Lysine histidine transporter 2-like protein n=7 Tax=Gossypium TaxID=3633 RepID=A0A0B0NUI9_GOSAR|nr:lysine histidine transporter 2 [Gossypium hirsutum]KAB2055496.1 hypothetical protein ES319_A11G041300v1 [Gossypium barbadense]KAK5782931.1 hypothetical protein PVK06_037436 [Gossypium arboreum]TYG92582.1 hypothetical protein ES288_A11G043200v1 [Gossypium darwinii]TYH99115.1 hypothetical protein ES332_A11G044200v1 [Gossypium tomentosum]TYJ07976.1 hypothetical protein E1A91_A11G042700v1 [Gossypium mustelinum]